MFHFMPYCHNKKKNIYLAHFSPLSLTCPRGGIFSKCKYALERGRFDEECGGSLSRQVDSSWHCVRGVTTRNGSSLRVSPCRRGSIGLERNETRARARHINCLLVCPGESWICYSFTAPLLPRIYHCDAPTNLEPPLFSLLFSS